MKKFSEAGFGLVEVMIASGILALVVGATTVFMQQSGDNLVYRSAKVEQQRLYNSIKSDLQKYDKVKFSATKGGSGNASLNRCLQTNPGKTSDCSPTSAADQIGFELWTRQGIDEVQKSGPSGGAMKYSLSGVRDCAAGTAYCPFWNVETYFWATCPGGLTSCDQASNIHTRFIIRPVRQDFKGIPLGALPPANDFDNNKAKFAISHNVTKSSSKIVGDQSCPVGAVMSGLNENGIIKCVCKGGFEEVLPRTNPIVCKPLPSACPTDQRIKGRNPDGSVKCAPQQKVCQIVAFASGAVTCPVGGWLEKIDLGTCRPAAATKKGTSRPISCDTNQGTCCYLDET